MTDFDIGEMKQKVTLQRKTPAPEAAGPAGDEEFTYEPAGTFWAKVEPLSGRELFNAVQVKSTISHRITMRVVGPVEPSDRFICNGRVFNVESVIRPGEVAYLYEIMATELRGVTP